MTPRNTYSLIALAALLYCNFAAAAPRSAATDINDLKQATLAYKASNTDADRAKLVQAFDQAYGTGTRDKTAAVRDNALAALKSGGVSLDDINDWKYEARNPSKGPGKKRRKSAPDLSKGSRTDRDLSPEGPKKPAPENPEAAAQDIIDTLEKSVAIAQQIAQDSVTEAIAGNLLAENLDILNEQEALGQKISSNVDQNKIENGTAFPGIKAELNKTHAYATTRSQAIDHLKQAKAVYNYAKRLSDARAAIRSTGATPTALLFTAPAGLTLNNDYKAYITQISEYFFQNLARFGTQFAKDKSPNKDAFKVYLAKNTAKLEDVDRDWYAKELGAPAPDAPKGGIDAAVTRFLADNAKTLADVNNPTIDPKALAPVMADLKAAFDTDNSLTLSQDNYNKLNAIISALQPKLGDKYGEYSNILAPLEP